jgi:hypothetical protein
MASSLMADIRATTVQAYKYKKLLLIGILIGLPNTMIAISNRLFLLSSKSEIVFFILMIGTVLVNLPLYAYLCAGYHGIIFLKMNNKEINVRSFFRLSKKAFWWFLLITFIMAIIEGLPLLTTSFVLSISKGAITEIPYRWLWEAVPVYSFLFFFSLPLVLLSYFSGKKLKSIRTSISLVFKQASKIKLVFLIMLIKFGLNISVHYLNLTGYVDIASYFVWLLIKSMISFFCITYAFNKLTKEFYPDLEFDFKR